MNWTVVQRILGLLLMMFSLTMLPPVIISLIFDDGSWLPFVEGFGLTLAAGFLFWLPVHRSRKELRLRDGFLVVAAFWTVLGTFGAAPLYFADALVAVTDRRGVRVDVRADDDRRHGADRSRRAATSILYYRQQLQWLGGMGIIVLAVAVLPMLGVGGMQLYRAETPGPVKDTKLTPRITETAKALWYVYLAFTTACALSYMAAGMSWFDALCHAFSTVAIGGFSTHDLSMGYFDSTAIELVAIVFMFAAGINFSLHFFAWRYVSVKHYSQDPEFRAYTVILLGVAVLVVFGLFSHDVFDTPGETIVTGLFQAVSIATTTGFTTANYAAWPAALPVLLLFASFVGGCAGSTAGGIKVVRWLLIYKQGVREIVRLVHPSAEIPVKLGNKAVQYRVVDAVWGFFSVYVVVFSAMMLAMMATGLDQVTAFSAIAATLNNLGPGLGDVSSGFMSVSDPGKWISIVAMLLGRLEIFTLLVLITPTFWRH